MRDNSTGTVFNKHSANPKKAFSSFYNKLVNIHALFKSLSRRKVKQFSKPWLSRGLISLAISENISCTETDYLVSYDKYYCKSGLIRQYSSKNLQ